MRKYLHRHFNVLDINDHFIPLYFRNWAAKENQLQEQFVDFIRMFFIYAPSNTPDVTRFVLKMIDNGQVKTLLSASSSRKAIYFSPYTNDIHQTPGKKDHIVAHRYGAFQWNAFIHEYYTRFDEMFDDKHRTTALVDQYSKLVDVSGVDYIVAMEGDYQPKKFEYFGPGVLGFDRMFWGMVYLLTTTIESS